MKKFSAKAPVEETAGTYTCHRSAGRRGIETARRVTAGTVAKSSSGSKGTRPEGPADGQRTRVANRPRPAVIAAAPWRTEDQGGRPPRLVHNAVRQEFGSGGKPGERPRVEIRTSERVSGKHQWAAATYRPPQARPNRPKGPLKTARAGEIADRGDKPPGSGDNL